MAPAPIFSKGANRFKINWLVVLGSLTASVLVSAVPFKSTRLESTPESTLRGLFAAINKQDWPTVFRRIEGVKVDSAEKNIRKRLRVTGKIPSFTVRYGSFKTAGNVSTVHVRIDFNATGPNQAHVSSEDDLRLHRTDSEWKLVGGGLKGSFVNTLVEIGKSPATTGKGKS